VNAGKLRATEGKLMQSINNVLQLNRGDIHFVSNVMYLGVTFYSRMTRSHHIKRIVAKALCPYVFSIEKWAFKYKY
jgi:hypothetical protein